jgi:hypothetical protein
VLSHRNAPRRESPAAQGGGSALLVGVNGSGLAGIAPTKPEIAVSG